MLLLAPCGRCAATSFSTEIDSKASAYRIKHPFGYLIYLLELLKVQVLSEFNATMHKRLIVTDMQLRSVSKLNWPIMTAYPIKGITHHQGFEKKKN